MVLSEIELKELIGEVVFSATRSSGPGGQNVNKVNTQVELRFSVQNSLVLNERQKQMVLVKLKNRINNDGELILVSRSERTQWRNKEKVSDKFFEIIRKALKPVKKRIKTKPSKASKLKRIESKKNNSRKKQRRKPPEW